MNPIDRSHRFAWSILAFALFIALGAAGKSTDAQPADPQAAPASPSSPAPALAPPAPPADPAPPSPPSQPAQAPQPPNPVTDPAASQLPAPAGMSGQWTFTSQYGWVWMPYAARYTSVSTDGAAAYMYVYYPAYGWRWVDAPWVLGWGPRPLWGALGPARFAWYAHPWFRVAAVHRAPWHAHAWHRR